MEELLGGIVQTGFSIVVASYLLVRMDKRMEELTRAVVHLGAVLEAKEVRYGEVVAAEDKACSGNYSFARRSV